eukprot:5973376-Ditylum_brightwellii.AAC.1
MGRKQLYNSVDKVCMTKTGFYKSKFTSFCEFLVNITKVLLETDPAVPSPNELFEAPSLVDDVVGCGNDLNL